MEIHQLDSNSNRKRQEFARIFKKLKSTAKKSHQVLTSWGSRSGNIQPENTPREKVVVEPANC